MRKVISFFPPPEVIVCGGMEGEMCMQACMNAVTLTQMHYLREEPQPPHPTPPLLFSQSRVCTNSPLPEIVISLSKHWRMSWTIRGLSIQWFPSGLFAAPADKEMPWALLSLPNCPQHHHIEWGISHHTLSRRGKERGFQRLSIGWCSYSASSIQADASPGSPPAGMWFFASFFRVSAETLPPWNDTVTLNILHWGSLSSLPVLRSLSVLVPVQSPHWLYQLLLFQCCSFLHLVLYHFITCGCPCTRLSFKIVFYWPLI